MSEILFVHGVIEPLLEIAIAYKVATNPIWTVLLSTFFLKTLPFPQHFHFHFLFHDHFPLRSNMSHQSYSLVGSDRFWREARRDCVFTPEQTVWLCEQMTREQRKKFERLATQRTDHAIVGDRDLAAIVFEEMTGCLRMTLRKLNKTETAEYQSIGCQSDAGSQQPVSARPGKEVGTSNSTVLENMPGSERRVVSLLDLSLLDHRKKVCKWDGKRQKTKTDALPAIDTTVGELGLKPEEEWLPRQEAIVNSVARRGDAGSQHQGSFATDGTQNRGSIGKLDLIPRSKYY